MQKIEGLSISSNDGIDNLRIITESKRKAEQYEWIYHCTDASSLLGILSSREFFLSNLKRVNDKEEAERIDIPEYEDKYFVACFTYDSQIPASHWIEYGTVENGILIAVKPAWFKRQATFLTSHNVKCEGSFHFIHENEDAALAFKIEEQKGKEGTTRIVNPFYINAFGFYQVIYDDKLKKQILNQASTAIDGESIACRILTPDITGIIKSTHGLCQRPGREPYLKEWFEEKEVRLKVGVQQYSIFKNGEEGHDDMIMQGVYFPKIAVPLTEDAFDEIQISFSPKFKNKEAFLEELKGLVPTSKITLMND